MESTDRSLIDAHCQGDPTAFATLLRRHGSTVLGYLVKLTGDRCMAEDLFQETFKRAHEKARTIRTDHVRPWLFRIATNLAMDGLRRKKSLKLVSMTAADCDGHGCPDFSAMIPAEAASDPAVRAELEERRNQVRRAIDALPPKQKTTLLLSYYQQLSYSEVADALGCSTGTVKTQMFRALKTLARILPSTAGGEQ
jgi:RNA polymerase sigma-70 factor (ECF subfamily)